jgi:PASTA domain
MSFTITTPSQTVRVSENGRADVIFNVANTSGVPARAMARVVATGGGLTAEWLSLAGESERDYAANGTQQLAVAVQIPPDVHEGSYAFRLDVISARKSGEERAESPIVTLAVPARSAPAPKKKSYAWIAVAALVFVLVAGVGTFLWLRGGADEAPQAAPVAAAAATPVTVSTTETTPTTETAPAATPAPTATTTASEPAAASAEPKPTKIRPKITVSALPVPNVVGMHVETAEKRLRGVKFKTTRQMVKDSSLPGLTVKAQHPPQSTILKVGELVMLDVVIEKVTVPNVKGMKWKEARQVIESVGLVPEQKSGAMHILSEVTAQIPPAGQRLARGERVTLVVGGPK